MNIHLILPFLVILSLTLAVVREWATLKEKFGSTREKVRSCFSKPDPNEHIKIGELYIPDSSRQRHTHIVGATGSGKTVLVEHLISQDIKRGHGVLIIDAKGDRPFFERIKAICNESGRGDDLFLLSARFSNESIAWNPCGLGDAHQLQSKFYASFTMSEPFYAKAVENGLLASFLSLTAKKNVAFSIFDLAREVRDNARKENNKNVEGLSIDLANLAMSEWSKVFSNNTGIKDSTFNKVCERGGVLYVDLPTESNLVQSQRIGRLLLSELMQISGNLKSGPERSDRVPFSVYIDEFDVFATENFSIFLNKARSSGIMIHMCHQTIGDLQKVSDSFSKQILGNANVRFIFRQDDPDDAETWARFLGTRETVATTWKKSGGSETGDSSNRIVNEFLVPPDEIKRLRTGHCIASIKDQNLILRLKVPRPSTLARILTNEAQVSRIERGFGETSTNSHLGEIEFHEPMKKGINNGTTKRSICRTNSPKANQKA